MDGGDGRDWYVFDQGFGVNHITDSGAGGNGIQFNFSFANSGITIGLGSLKLSFADGSELHIDNFDANDPTGTCSIDTFSFADRTLSLQEILDIGMDVVGTPDADFIRGTGMNERINALAGDDTILAGGGNDVVDAGAGNDYVDAGGGNDIVNGGEGINILLGGAGNDTIVAGSGNDTLDGGTGADTLTGGAGDDTYILDSASDAIVEVTGEGSDTVQSSITYTLANTLENLALLGSANINATGNAQNNVLTGNGGNNLLNGGTGADAMLGGAGNDTYIVDNTGDIVTEALNAGSDLVQSGITYTLTDNVEDLTLTGAAAINGTGNASNNVITGNNAINMLMGGDGNDTIYGMDGADMLNGGAGADVMNGGYGNDTYYVDNAGDQLVEAYVGKTITYSWGTTIYVDFDTVYAPFSYTLGTNLECLYLTGTDNLNGTGNALNNTIVGNDGANILTGNAGMDVLNGGAGADTLYGGDGADTLDGGLGADVMQGGSSNDNYVVDDTGDQVIENGVGIGTTFMWHIKYGSRTHVGDYDSVKTSVSYTLGNYLEQLELTGTGNINGAGNAQNNLIIGNAGMNMLFGNDGNDILDGFAGTDVLDGSTGTDKLYGGTGDDVLMGGSGNDTLYGEAGNDNLLGGMDADTLYGGDDNDTLMGGDGNDAMYGEAGDDSLRGEAGNDMLRGDLGNDAISGDEGNDTIYGDLPGIDSYSTSWFYSVADTLDGGAGDDYIDGQMGNDTVYGGAGNDTLLGGADGSSNDGLFEVYVGNDDMIDGGDGNDTINGGSGADTLVGGAGNDVITGGDGNISTSYLIGANGYEFFSNADVLDGGDGDDVLDGQAGDDVIYGGAGNDILRGGSDNYALDASGNSMPDSNNDLLDGGTGVDVMEGGTGDDVYAADGTYTRVSGTFAEINDCGDLVLVNGERLRWATDTVTEYAGEGYDIVMSSASYTLTGNVEELQLVFDAGTATTDPQYYADMMVYGQDGTGNDSDNVIIGNELANRLEGGVGADVLDGLGGSDKLIGGIGDDSLLGGAGDDRYVFHLGDGADTIDDWQGNDTLYIGSDLTAADLEAHRVGNNAVLNITGTSDSVTLKNWYVRAEGISRVEFCDATVLDKSGIEGLFNAPPTANSDVVIVSEDAGISTIAAADLLANDADPDAGDSLSMVGFDTVTAQGNTVSQDANGNLVLDIGNAYQSLGAGQTATDSFSYTISDAAGATSTAAVNVAIVGANDAPAVAIPMAGQQTDEDAPLSFAIPAGTFTDIDNGDTLTYSATLADGSALPGWLTFDAVTQTFSGTPGNSDVGSLNVLVTAADMGGLSAASAFSLNVANVNDAPVATDDTIVTHEDATTTSIAAAGLLANDYDVDVGDTFTLSGFDAVSANGNAVALDAMGNLVLDIGNRYQSLAAGETATDSFRYTVTDAAGATATATVNVTINGLNDGLVAQDDFAGMSQDAVQPAIGNVLANDSDVDQGTMLSVANAGVIAGSYGSLTLSADGSYSYTLDNALVQSLGAGQSVTETFAYQATDGIATTPATLTVTIAGMNDAPVAAAPIANQQTDEDAPLSFAIPAGTFTDIDNGDTLTYSATLADGSALPGWLTFDAVTQSFSGTPGNSDVGSLNVLVTAADMGGLSASSTFSLNVVNVNDAPTANADTGAAIEDGGAVLLDAATLLANDTDQDVGDTLSIAGFDSITALGNTVSMDAAGNLVFDPSTGSGQGDRYQSLAQGEVLTDTFSYTITDTAGATSTAQVSMTIAGVNDAPVAVADAASVQEDLSIAATGNVLANDSDVDRGTVLSVLDAGIRAGSYGTLTLAADGGYTYAVDNASMTVQSLGRAAQVAEHFGYTATDGIAGAASVLDVFLNGTNDAPILVAPLADQDFTFHKHFSWQVPDGSFIDIDHSDTLDYAATLADGSALPDWLSFDAASRTFSGETPKETGFVDVRVIATDKVAATGSTTGSLSASDVFRISVSHGNEGLGNGADAPPAGHDRNRNDGAGTAPGRPGAKGGKDYPTASAAHPNEQEPQDYSSDAEKHKGDTPSQDNEDSGSRRTDELIRAWFEEESASEQYSSFGKLDRHGAWGGQIDWQVKRNVARGVAGDISSEWERMNARLKKHLEQTGFGDGITAEFGAHSRLSGLYISGSTSSIPQSGMGGDLLMREFSGLKEGLERLGC